MPYIGAPNIDFDKARMRDIQMLCLARTEGMQMRTIVNIDVPELAPAIEFYSNALGLELSRIIDDDVAELTGTSSAIYLLVNTSGSVATSSIAEVRRYSRHWTPVHIDFVVEDLFHGSGHRGRCKPGK